MVLGVDSQGACGEAGLLSDVLCVCARVHACVRVYVCVRETLGTFFCICMHIRIHCISSSVQEKLPPTVLMTGAKRVSRETHTPHTPHTQTHTRALLIQGFSRVCCYNSATICRRYQQHISQPPRVSAPLPLPPTLPFVCPSQLPFRLSLLSTGVRALWLRGECLEESQVLVWHGEGCLAWGRGRGQSWLSAPGPGTTPGPAHSSSLSQTGTLVGD